MVFSYQDGLNHHLLIACTIITKAAAITILHKKDGAPRQPVELTPTYGDGSSWIYPIVTVQQLEEIKEKFFTEQEDECLGPYKHQAFSEVFYEYLSEYKEKYVSILYHHTITPHLAKQTHG